MMKRKRVEAPDTERPAKACALEVPASNTALQDVLDAAQEALSHAICKLRDTLWEKEKSAFERLRITVKSGDAMVIAPEHADIDVAEALAQRLVSSLCSQGATRCFRAALNTRGHVAANDAEPFFLHFVYSVRNGQARQPVYFNDPTESFYALVSSAVR